MGTPHQVTADGLDLQLATNHFGPFLLTGLLLPQLVASGAATVVTVSSQHAPHRARRRRSATRTSTGAATRKWPVYGQTKLANLLFTYELDRRPRERELPVKALAAHPGFAGTHLAANGQYGRSSGGIASILDATIKAVSQPAAHGAWPLLMAATADLPGGDVRRPGRPRRDDAAPPGRHHRRAARTTRTRSAGCGSSARRPRGSATPDRVRCWPRDASSTSWATSWSPAAPTR